MKKPVKITLISLASVIGVLVITVVVVCSLVFSKERLTALVKDYANEYITCQNEIGEVELSFFGNFPKVSLLLNDVAIINPMEGAQNDTVLGVQRLYAELDVMAYLKEEHINITGFTLVNAQANIFVNEDSLTNFNVFKLETTPEEAADTTSSEMLLDKLSLHNIDIENMTATYLDQRNRMDARCQRVYLSLDTDASLQTLTGGGDVDLEIGELFYSDSLNYGQLTDLKLKNSHLFYDGKNAKVEVPKLAVATQNYLLSGETALLAQIWNMSLEDVKASWQDERPTFEGVTKLDSSEVTLGKEDLMYVKMGSVLLDMPVESTAEKWTTKINTSFEDLCFSTDADGVLLDRMDVKTKMTASTSSKFNDFEISDMKATLGSQSVTGGAHVDMTDTTVMKADVDVVLKATTIDEILALVPAAYKESLKGMTLSADLSDSRIRAQLEVAEKLQLKHVDVKSELSGFRYSDDTNLKCGIEKIKATVGYPAGSARNQFSIEGNLDALTVAMVDDTTKIHIDIPSGTANILLRDDIMDGKDPRLNAKFNLSKVQLAMDDTVKVELKSPEGSADVDMASAKNCIKVSSNAKFAGFSTKLGKSFEGSTGAVNLDLKCLYDDRQKEALDMVSPVADFNLKQATFKVEGVPYDLIIPEITATFNKDKAALSKCQLNLGNSQMTLNGVINNINDWLKGKKLLEGNLKLSSPLVDAGQLMEMTSGMGCEEETATTETASTAESSVDHSQGDPFMVPKDVKFVITTDIKNVKVDVNNFENVKGQLTIDDGVLVLEEMGFTSKAAKMQLTALYKSPRKNNLFAGWNFHLLDIDIAEMIRLVPEIDTIVPMISSFAGKAEFHLAGETSLFADYSPKMSTLKAVAAIEGKDLTVLDSETFQTIKKYLFKDCTTNKIDTMSIELAVARKKMTLYPMLIGWDKYEAVISGNHTIVDAMPFNYHISITKCPLVGGHLGLDITGNLDDIDNIGFKLGSCKYANLYRPEKRNVTQSQTLELKSLINSSLKRTVKEQ